MSTQGPGSGTATLQERKTGGVWCWEGSLHSGAAACFPLLSYLQGSHRTVGCQVQVLSQVEIISKHGEMSCQKIVVLDSLQIKVSVRRNIRILVFKRLCSVGSGASPPFSCFNKDWLKCTMVDEQHLHFSRDSRHTAYLYLFQGHHCANIPYRPGNADSKLHLHVMQTGSGQLIPRWAVI